MTICRSLNSNSEMGITFARSFWGFFILGSFVGVIIGMNPIFMFLPVFLFFPPFQLFLLGY